MVPIIMNTDVVVYLDSTLDQFKCTEAIIQTFFKNKEYYSFKFNGHDVYGNVRFSQGTNDDSIYRVITKILNNIEINDSDYLFDIGSNIGLTSIVMSDASICGLGQAASNPLKSVIKYFPEELKK